MNLYFAGDVHLGAPSYEASLPRMQRFIQWLEEISPHAKEVYLMGDIFDFWFAYRYAVPKGYLRLFAALLGLTDRGVKVHWLLGNHDLWADEYWEKELGIHVHRQGIERSWQGKTFFIHHGHTLGPLGAGERLSLFLMQNRFLRYLYRWIHPDIGLFLGARVSARSRRAHHPMDVIDLGEREYLHQYVMQQIQKGAFYQGYIFGHRHLAKLVDYGPAWMALTGDWISKYTYLELDGDGLCLWHYAGKGQKVCLQRLRLFR
ncbi:MAG: UDP-2,3-diacylglucosamine diphosphatase [Bacteroidia bacterium]